MRIFTFNLCEKQFLVAYRNPYHIFGLDPFQKDPKKVKYARNKLFAEFELENATEIEVLGVKLDRSTVIRLWESLDDPAQQPFHQYIAQNPILREFLESEGKTAVPDDFGPLEEKSFLRFMSPILKEVLPGAIRQTERELRVQRLKHLMDMIRELPRGLSLPVMEEVASQVRLWSRDMLERVSQVKGKKFRKGYLLPDIEQARLEMVLGLPEFFQSEKEGYFSALISLTDALHNHKVIADKEIVAALKEVMKSDIPESARALIQFRLDAIYGMENFLVSAAEITESINRVSEKVNAAQTDEEIRRNRSRSTWSILGVLVFFLFLVVLLASLGGGSGYRKGIEIPKFDFPTLDYENYDFAPPASIPSLDSLRKKRDLKDSGSHLTFDPNKLQLQLDSIMNELMLLRDSSRIIPSPD